MLMLHIVAGSIALVLGPVAMFSKKRRGTHTRAGIAYHFAVLVACVSAVILAVLAWQRLWWFAPIAVGSYAFALVGYVSARYRPRGWLRWHISGMGGSYIAMTTALLVVNWDLITGAAGVTSPLAWALPTIIGSPIIASVTYRYRNLRESRAS